MLGRAKNLYKFWDFEDFSLMSSYSWHSPSGKVKAYWRNTNYWRLIKPLYNTLQYCSRMTSSILQKIYVNRQNIFEGCTKSCTLLCSPRIGFCQARKLYWSWNNGPIGSIDQPMNQCGNKKGRQVIWQRTPKNRISPICLHLTVTPWKVAETTAHQRLIFKVQKLVEAFI